MTRCYCNVSVEFNLRFYIYLDFFNSGIATILDQVQPNKFGPILQQTELDDNAMKLRAQEYELLVAEIEYGIKTWTVWKKKIQDFEIRLLSLKDDWLLKRHAAAKTATDLKMFVLNL